MADLHVTINETIDHSFDMFIQGHLTEMEHSFNSIPPNVSFEKVAKLKFEVIKAHLLRIKGKYDDAKQIIMDIISQSRKNDDLIYTIDAYIILDHIENRNLSIQERFESLEKAKILLNDIAHNSKVNEQIIHRIIWLKLIEGSLNFNLEKNNVANDFFQEALNLSVKIQNQFDIGVSSRLFALNIEDSEPEKAKDLLLKALDIFRSISNPHEIALCLQRLGYNSSVLGDYNQTLKYYQESLTIRNEVGNKFYLFSTLLGFAHVYEQLDNINKALEFHDKCLEVALEINNKYQIIASYGWKLVLVIELGDIEIADNLFKKYYDLAMESGDKFQKIFVPYYLKSRISAMKGDITDALKLMQKANEYLLKMDFINYLLLIQLYITCINYALELKDKNLAYSYLEKIKTYLDKTDDQLLNAQIKENINLAKALIFKESRRIKEKAKAQEFFESSIDDTKRPYWYKNIAMIQLCGMYLEELEKYGDQQTLEDLKNLVLRIQDRAKVRNSTYLLIKAIIIQAKLLLVEGEIKNAENILNEALTISRDKNLIVAEKEVIEELKQLQDWKNLSLQKKSFQERIQKAQISNYINDAKNLIGPSQLNLK